MKIYLVICFSAAAVAIAVISLLGADRVPGWVLPGLVFGVPILAVVVVFMLNRSKTRRDQEERERKAIRDAEEMSTNITE